MSRFIFILVFFAVLAVEAKFPDDPKPCKYGDSECIVKVINYLITEKATQGDRDLNLVKLDPLSVAEMKVNKGADSPVNIDLTFTDSKAYGISTIKFSKIKGFGKTIARKHELHFNATKLSLVGPYNIKGKVLILPITGTGKSNLTLVNCDMFISFTGKPYEKDGGTYMEATNLKLIAKPERMYFYFSNLFNGDKALGDNMNAFLNENWEAIYLELEQPVKKLFAEIFQAIITNVFSKYPYAKFFEEYINLIDVCSN